MTSLVTSSFPLAGEMTVQEVEKWWGEQEEQTEGNPRLSGILRHGLNKGHRQDLRKAAQPQQKRKVQISPGCQDNMLRG